MNKHTRSVKWIPVPEPDSARSAREEREHQTALSDHTLVFQPLDASITDVSVQEWCVALSHHILFAKDAYELPSKDSVLPT